MICKECQKLSLSYLDNKLDQVIRDQVKRHLDQCSDCRERLAITQQIQLALTNLPRFKAPGVIWDRIEQVLPEREVFQPGLNRFRRYLWPVGGLAAVAAALLLTLLSIFDFTGEIPVKEGPPIKVVEVQGYQLDEIGIFLTEHTRLEGTVALLGNGFNPLSDELFSTE